MNSIMCVAGGTLITPQETIPQGAVFWDASGRIVETGPARATRAPTMEASGLLVCPGFINLHVHGGQGVDAMDASPPSLALLAKHQAAQGVSAFLPTTVTAPQADLLAVAEAVRAYRASPAPGAEVLGLHLEGPYLAQEKIGAQNPTYLRDPSWSELAQLQVSSGNAVRLVSLAPERDPDGEFTRKLVERGVFVSAAHTDASYETTRISIQNGLSHATHIFNAMSRFNYRAPGALEALLENERISLELIPDCTAVPHVHPVVIRLLRRLVGVKRICTVTDAISASGMPDGIYELGEMAVYKRDDLAFLQRPWERDGTLRLAGSVLEMQNAVRNLVEQCGFTLEEAVMTASQNPARALGIAGERGSLAVGKLADLTLLDPQNFEVQATFVRGKLVYQRAKGSV